MRAIVGDYLFRNAEVAYNILPNKVLDFTVMDLIEGLSLYPLGEIVDEHYHKPGHSG